MRCEDIMKHHVRCVSPRDTVRGAALQMREENVGFLPVCAPSRKVIGTLTDRDLAIRVLADGLPPTTLIEDVFSHEVIACHPEDDLRKAEELMSKHRKSRIVCVDGNGRLAGVISLSDIAQREPEAWQMLRTVSEREARA